MKLSTTVAALLVLGESNAAAYKETSTRRMRSVKLYSSTLEYEVVDPYIGLPDERREQRSLEAHSMPLTTLELSMPSAAAASVTDQSFSYSLEDSAPAAGDNAVLPVVTAAEATYNSAIKMGCFSVVFVATTVSVIAGVVALM